MRPPARRPAPPSPRLLDDLKKRKRVACSYCRQSKVRCDAPRHPCSQCEKRGLPCEPDAGMPRVSKKR